MVNQLRTLLLNRGRDGYGPDFPGEEYLVSNYRRRRLTGAAKRAWECLFGLTPDRLFLNFRLRQLLTVAHTSELAEFVTEADTRITYWPFDDTTLAAVFGISVKQQHGDTALPYIFGEPFCDEGAGRCEQSWQITALSATQLTIADRTLSRVSVPAALTFAAGLSSVVPIPGSAISLSFRVPAPGDIFVVTSRGQPQLDLGEVFAGLTAILGPSDAASLFPADTATGRTLLAVWTKHPISMTRYAALILALASAVERSPQEG